LSLSLRVLPLVLGLVFALAGCGGTGSDGPGSTAANAPFAELEEAARGTTVNFFMYGGDDATNSYVDEWVTPRLKEEYGVALERAPVSDTADVVNKLLNEKQVGKEEGTVDLVWINGENFYTGSQADLWFGPWANKLPNAKYIAWDSPQINRDFGYPVEGYEAPWSQAQFVMVYDSARVDDPPRNMEELMVWVEDNPGRFTYPAPPDFTGNAFVEQAFYQITGRIGSYQKSFDEALFREQAPKFYHFMNDLEPSLWRAGGTYPTSSAALDELYRDGQVDFTMSYNPYHGQRQVVRGIFPETTRSYLFEGGTLSNTSYVAIPFNAPNKAGAQVAANFLQSPEAQLELQRRNVVGGLATLDLDRLPKGLREKFTETSGRAAPAPDELQKNRVPEARTGWLLEIQDDWIRKVQKEE